jgi:hypothetical protein
MNDKNKYLDFVEDTVISIYANMRDLREKLAYCDPEECEYISGRLFTYQEMLEILRFGVIKFDLKNEIKI